MLSQVSVINRKSKSYERKKSFKIKDLFERDLALINAIDTEAESEED